jgi:hypothetical protein
MFPVSVLFLAVTAFASADDSPAPAPATQDKGPQFSFGMSAALGTETILDTNYETFGLLPDFGYGPFGVGIDLSFHFQFYEQPGGNFGFYPRKEDWWDSSLSTRQNIDKYLARIAYLRWGHKGDPLYAQIGLLPSTTLGTGFIVGGYNNGALRPELNYIGLELDAKGELVGLPYGGFESFVGNISAFDVVGARVYLTPFALTNPDNAFLKAIQFGVTGAADTNPYSEVPNVPNQQSGQVIVGGVDTLVPLVSGDLFSAQATADAAVQGSHEGGEIGVGGKAIGFLVWGLQNRFLGEDFLPQYFDSGYEINRVEKFAIYRGDVTVPATVGWVASLGTTFLGDQLTFGATLSGPWTSQDNELAQPELQSYATLKAGILPVDLNAFYVKTGLTSFGELTSPENALIGAKAGYTIGAVTLNIVYNLRYLTDGEAGPNGKNWVSTSSIQTAVKMF